MSSGGKKTSTTTSSNAPPAWSIPYFQGALNQAQGLANQEYKPYTGPQQAAAGQMNPYATNAYTDQMVKQAGQDITNQYQNAVAPNLMAQFNSAGAYGGSAHQQALEGSQGQLARELGNSANNIRFGQAEAQRDEWSQAQARLQGLYDKQYDQYVDQRDFGANRFGLLTGALGTIQGGTGTQTGANPNYRSAGQNAMTAAALFASMYG